jgi:hypothetical protein
METANREGRSEDKKGLLMRKVDADNIRNACRTIASST